MGCYIFYDLINHQKHDSPSVVKSVLLNILSSLSAPLTICSGGACNSIYISTITSILSSFSVPLTLAVPLLNVFGYAMQLFGLISLYSANKWRSIPFWVYLVAMLGQIFSSHYLINWICCGLMITATVVNAKTNKFMFGKNKKLFNSSIVWFFNINLNFTTKNEISLFVKINKNALFEVNYEIRLLFFIKFSISFITHKFH